MAHERRAAVHLHGADVEPLRGLAQERPGGVRRGARVHPDVLPPGGWAGGPELLERLAVDVGVVMWSNCTPPLRGAALRRSSTLCPPRLHRPPQDAPDRRLARRTPRTPLGQFRRDARLPRPPHLPPNLQHPPRVRHRSRGWEGCGYTVRWGQVPHLAAAWLEVPCSTWTDRVP